VDLDLSELLPVAELLSGLSSAPDWILAGAVFLLTATLMAFGVPGIVIPLSVASGALLGPAYAAATVALGGLIGSQLFFLAARRALSGRARLPRGDTTARFTRNFGRYGMWYVVGLRLAGAPHFALTSACAILPIGKTAFAAATLLGLLPIAFVAASLGSSF
jgi:uncharacterized membrane protein YdjX (TVP38/TMEM64 family)